MGTADRRAKKNWDEQDLIFDQKNLFPTKIVKLEKKVAGSEKVASLPQIVPIVSQSRVGNVNKLFNKFPF